LRDRVHERMDPTVSIVVAVRNEARSIQACLAALQRQEYPPARVEIVVADGMSEDGTPEIVAAISRDDPRVRLVTNHGRTAPCGFNAGLLVATGSVLGIMSGHARAAPDYVRRGVDDLQVTGAWAVGGRIVRVGETTAQAAIARVTSSPFGVGDAIHNYATVAGPVETVFPGLWPRSVLERVGLFDPELIRNQDDELSYRVRAAGGTIWYDPALQVVYEPRGSLSSLFSQYRQYAMWKVRVYQKHPRSVRSRQLVPAAWIACVVGGSVAGLFLQPIWVLPVAAIGAYIAVMSIPSLRLAGSGVSGLRILGTLLVLHAAYGIGMWQGLVRFASRWLVDRDGAPPRLPSGSRGVSLGPAGHDRDAESEESRQARL